MNTMPDGPEIGNEDFLGAFFTNPFPFLRDCLNKYGNIFTLPLGDFGVKEFGVVGEWVFLTHEDDLRALYKANPESCLAGKGNYIQFSRLLPIDGSLMLDGDAHFERRRLLTKLIQGDKNIHKFADDIIQATQQEIENFPPGEVFDLTDCFRRIISQVISHMNFGPQDDPRVLQISARMWQFGEAGLAIEGKHRVISDCTNLVAEIFTDFKKCPHAQAQHNESMLSTLHTAQQNGAHLSDQQLQSELVILLASGYGTTITALAWIMAQLFSHASVYARACDEIRQVLKPGVPHQACDFDQLPYLDAVIFEACRLSPQMFTTSVRLLAEPMQIGKYNLPAGTIVANSPYLVHTREDHYDNPLQFIPERFLDSAPDPYKHVFFGGGNRRCVATAFTLYKMKVIVALLLWKSNLEPVNLSLLPELQGFFFGPKGGVRVKVKAKGESSMAT